MDNIKLYGADWCPDCIRAKSFLDEKQIEYDFIDVDMDEEATKKVERINEGKRIIPTLIINGRSYSNPDNGQLASVLGINDHTRIVMYGADWCPDCRKSKSFLDDNKVNYQYIDTEEHEWAIPIITKINNGKRKIPTIVINDEQILVEPDNEELRVVLHLEQSREEKVFDVIIIGGGAAGLTASIYAERDRFSSLILEKKNIGGNAFLTEKIENYPGFTSISGPELMDKMKEQAQVYGATIKTGEEVTDIRKENGIFRVTTKSTSYCSKAVILATGSSYRQLGIPGESEMIGSGVHFCATCDGAFYRDKDIIVVGGGNSALEEGIFLSGFVKSVKIITRDPDFTASETYTEKLPGISNITTYKNKNSLEFISEDGKFKGLLIEDNYSQEQELIEADGAFVFIGLTPNTKTFKELVELNEQGFIVTHEMAQTSVDGIFAAGDCRHGAIAQVAAATGEGVLASYGVKKYLK